MPKTKSSKRVLLTKHPWFHYANNGADFDQPARPSAPLHTAVDGASGVEVPDPITGEGRHFETMFGGRRLGMCVDGVMGGTNVGPQEKPKSALKTANIVSKSKINPREGEFLRVFETKFEPNFEPAFSHRRTFPGVSGSSCGRVWPPFAPRKRSQCRPSVRAAWHGFSEHLEALADASEEPPPY